MIIMKVYVCVTYFDAGDSIIEGVCTSYESAQELAKICNSEIEEFETWD